jgi:hypothetical protein
MPNTRVGWVGRRAAIYPVGIYGKEEFQIILYFINYKINFTSIEKGLVYPYNK